MTSRKNSRDRDTDSRKNSSASDDTNNHSKVSKIPRAPSYTHHILHLATCADNPDKCAAGKCDIDPPTPTHPHNHTHPAHHTKKLSKSDKSDKTHSHSTGSASGSGSGSGNNGGKGKGKDNGGMTKPHEKHHKGKEGKGKKEKEPFRPLPPSPPPLPQKHPHKGQKNNKEGSLEKPFYDPNAFGNLERQIVDEATQDSRKILQSEQTQYESFPGANKRNAETMKYAPQDGSSQYTPTQKSKFGNNTNTNNTNTGTNNTAATELCLPPQAVHMICTPEPIAQLSTAQYSSNSNSKRNDTEKNSEKILAPSSQTPDIPIIRNASAIASSSISANGNSNSNSNRYSYPNVPTVMMARSIPPSTTEGTQFQGIEDSGIQYNEPKNTSTQSDAIPFCEPPPKCEDDQLKTASKSIPQDNRNLSKGIFQDGAQNQNQNQNHNQNLVQEQHTQRPQPPKKQQHGHPPQHLQGNDNKNVEQYENEPPSHYTGKMPLPPLPPPRNQTSVPPPNLNLNSNSTNANSPSSARPLPVQKHWTQPKAYYPPYQDSNNKRGKNQHPSIRASGKQEEEKCVPCTPEQLAQEQQQQKSQAKEEICFPIDDSNRTQFMSRANPIQIPKNRYDYYSDDSVFPPQGSNPNQSPIPPEQSYENQLAQSFSTRPASAPTSTSTPKSSRGKSRAMQRKSTNEHANGGKANFIPVHRPST